MSNAKAPGHDGAFTYIYMYKTTPTCKAELFALIRAEFGVRKSFRQIWSSVISL